MEIPKMDSFWDDQLVGQAHSAHRHIGTASQQPVGVGTGAHSPYERNLNFATVAVEDGEYGFPKKKTVRDPLSHRIIEKRRRDRMNNCLADLARLLPPSSLRKGRGRIEKTEIVELAIKHLRHLQCHPCPMGDKCEFSTGTENPSGGGTHNSSPCASCSSSTSSGYHSSHEEQFRLGFQECLSESMHFLVEQEGLYAGDAMCVRLVKHLNNHCDTVASGHWGNPGKIAPEFRRVAEASSEFKKTSGSGASTSSGYHPNCSSSGSDGNGGNEGEGADAFTLPGQSQSQNLNVESSRHSSSIIDFEAENSCPSTPLSIETSDVLSTEGKNNGHLTSKPPIPSIICSHSSSNNSGSPANGSNGRSSDDGSANSSGGSAHRYKFKSNIKQRFTADCQKPEDDVGYSRSNNEKLSSEVDDVGRDDGGSDIEEREEEISEIDDSRVAPRLSQSEAAMGIKGNRNVSYISSNWRESTGTGGSGGVGASKTVAQEISLVGPSSSKTVCRSTTPNHSVTSSSPLSSTRNQEVKPSPNELLSAVSAIRDLSAGADTKTPLPLIISGDAAFTDGKGIPAFALHDKGLFYIPLTIDKSIIASYASKFDTCNAPPLYPVTISVCFLLNADKQAKHEIIQNLDIGLPLSNKVVDLCQAKNSIPLPLTSGSSCGTNSVKSNRRSYRDSTSSNFLMSRFNQQNRASKDSSHNRTFAGTTAGYNYQLLSHLSPSGSSGFEMLRGSSNSSPSMHGNPSGNCHPNYQDSSAVASSTVPTLNEMSRGENENHLCGGRSNTCGSSSGSSTTAMNTGRTGRKRSVSSSPSVSGSGGSLGYHSWNEKGSSNSHDYYNFHPNNPHAPLQTTSHGHGQMIATPSSILGSVGHRYDQSLRAFNAESLRDKETYFNQSHDKRSKKSRSVDQTATTTLESKQQ